jgi:hypothetical protein
MHKFRRAALLALVLIAPLLFLSACKVDIKVRSVSPSSTSTPSTSSSETTENVPLPENLNLRRVAARGVQDILNATGFTGVVHGRGERPDTPLSDHPDGMAADFDTSSKAEGDMIAEYCQKNAKRLKIKYILWQVKDHFGHVHVSFKDD